MVRVKVKLIHEDAKMPVKANATDAGFDIFAVDDGKEGKEGFIEYSTGLVLEPAAGYHVEIYPRSSISKYSLTLANSVGIIDNSYRGEVKIRFKPSFGFGQKIYDSDDFKLYNKGDRIAQMIVKKTESVVLEQVKDVSETERGSGGFGSSGV